MTMTRVWERRARGRRAAMLALLLAGSLATAGCATADRSGLRFDGAAWTNGADATALLPTLIREGEEALAENELERASRLFNAALKLDITNADLQFLNAFTYHLIGVADDSTKLELAEEGLKLALKFDPGHLAARYQLGLLYMDQRRYALAQGYFAAVALHRSDDPRVLYNLAASSYYAHDPRTAEAALNRLADVAPEEAARPEILQAQAVTKAALNDAEAAGKFLESFRVVADGDFGPKMLERRVSAWRAFYEHDAEVLLAQADPYGGDPYGGENPYGGDPYGTEQGTTTVDPYDAVTETPATPAAPSDMVVVDVVLIGMQEDTRDSRGVNLLNGLALQFGDPLTGTAGFRYTENRVQDPRRSDDDGLDEYTRTITKSIGIPAVTYSLNIANSADADNEILAKPSLVAQSGQTSEFFSGTEILAAAVSGGDGDSVSVQKEVGVKLAVTPEMLDDDMLRLHVVAERTFLTDPASSVVFEFRLDTTKTNVNATVTMRYGETLVLGGLSERETSRSKNGVPGLMDVPGLNLFFSERSERQFERSILILMTPRRPQYTRQDAAARDETRDVLSPLERDLERLNHRHEDWYTPRPTFNEIIDRLQVHEFFDEFRTGDVMIESWYRGNADLAHVDVVRHRLAED